MFIQKREREKGDFIAQTFFFFSLSSYSLLHNFNNVERDRGSKDKSYFHHSPWLGWAGVVFYTMNPYA